MTALGTEGAPSWCCRLDFWIHGPELTTAWQIKKLHPSPGDGLVLTWATMPVSGHDSWTIASSSLIATTADARLLGTMTLPVQSVLL